MIESIANCCCHSYFKISKEVKLNSDYYILDIKILNRSVSPILPLSCLFIQSSLYCHISKTNIVILKVQQQEINYCTLLKINANLPLPKDYFNVFFTLKLGLHISRKDRKHMPANTFFKLSRYALVFSW